MADVEISSADIVGLGTGEQRPVVAKTAYVWPAGQYADLYALRYSANLKQRLTVAVVRLAMAILDNPRIDALDDQRRTWARTAMADPGSMAERWMWYVVAEKPVRAAGEAIEDAVLQRILNGLLPLMAGIG